MTPKVIDNDRGDITVEVFGKEVRGWSYKDDTERRVKMVAAHEYAEGWHCGLARMKERLDLILNNNLCEMKEGYDDSIVGFNEAWDLVRKAFEEHTLITRNCTMADFRAPQYLFDAFANADEDTKAKIRSEVVAWLRSLENVQPGDRVIAPHPVTGEEEVFTKSGSRH